jgi:hypothetical protein
LRAAIFRVPEEVLVKGPRKNEEEEEEVDEEVE